MSANFTPEQNDYKNLTPFKCWLLHQINNWGLTNFPFVESDFDELTNYGMMQKLMNAVNDVISNENEVEQDMTNLFGSFTELQNYINNYFDNLDVQDEINAKLDEMASNGELEELLDNLYDDLRDEVNEKLYEQDVKINSVTSGSPLAATSTSDMTDTTRIYVNTTDGKWYYYNGSAWTIGGTYQASVDPDNYQYLYDVLGNLFKNVDEQFTTDDPYGQFNITTGNVIGSEYQNSRHTDGYFPVLPMDGLIITLTGYGTSSQAVIAMYDENKTYIGGITTPYPNAYTLDTYTLDLSDPQYASTRYVRFSTYVTESSLINNTRYKIEYPQPWETDIDELDEKIDNLDLSNYSLLDSFLKIGVCGDSLSVGWMAKPDSTYDDRNLEYSWPQYFARQHGVDVLNFGKSGITAKGWISDSLCYTLAQQTGNKSQCYIIGLGVNDTSATYTGGWGTTADIKSDYTQNVDSFFGCYGGIIQRLKEINSDCVIFCLSIPGARESTEKNGYIQQIANYFGKSNNVHFVDLTAYDSIFNNAKMQEFYVQGHYEAVGYNLCSQIVSKAISTYMWNNSQYFKYIGFIPY